MAFCSPSERDARLCEDKGTPVSFIWGSRAIACHRVGLQCVFIEGRKEGIKERSGSQWSILFPPGVSETTFLSSSVLKYGLVGQMLWRPQILLCAWRGSLLCIYKALGLHLSSCGSHWGKQSDLSGRYGIISFGHFQLHIFQMASYTHNQRITTFGQLHWTRQ